MKSKQKIQTNISWSFWNEIDPLIDKNNLKLTEEQAHELLFIFMDIIQDKEFE